MAKRSASSARGAQAGKRERRTGRKTDFSDIPELSGEELRAMRRVGRPPLGTHARELIAIRVDPQVLAQFRREAKRQNIGYQTLINKALAEHLGRKDVA